DQLRTVLAGGSSPRALKRRRNNLPICPFSREPLASALTRARQRLAAKRELASDNSSKRGMCFRQYSLDSLDHHRRSDFLHAGVVMPAGGELLQITGRTGNACLRHRIRPAIWSNPHTVGRAENTD